MSVSERLKSILGVLKMPVKQDVYRGKEEHYIVFNLPDERSALSGDDLDIMSETTVQVHLYTKNNPQPTKTKIRRLLRLGGFVISSTNQFYENDTGYTHVVVTASITDAIPADELPGDEEEY